MRSEGVRLTVVGNPGNRRVALFRAAARAAGAPDPVLLPWSEVLRGRCELTPGTLLRVDSPGEDDEVDELLRGSALGRGWSAARVEGGAAWYERFTAGLRTLAEAVATTPGCRLLGDVDEWSAMFDKRRTHALLAAAGVPVPEALPQDGRPLTGWDDLRARLAERGLRRVFVKPAHGSSASGVVALSLGPRGQAVATTSAELRYTAPSPAHATTPGRSAPRFGVEPRTYEPRDPSAATGPSPAHAAAQRRGAAPADAEPRTSAGGAPSAHGAAGEVRLFNSLHVRRYTGESELRALFDALARDPLHVERWLPKAAQHGRPADLRVVVTAGRATHAVVRTSRHPMTNLHLGGARGDLGLPREAAGRAWPELLDVAERAARCFPRSVSVGVDLLPAIGWQRYAVGEVNAFGDLLPGLTGLPGGPAEGRDTYAAFVHAALNTPTGALT